MARTHTFKGSLDSYGYGYFGYIEEGQLVLGENWPREGGITYRGPYATAGHELAELKQKAPRLYNSITKYYTDEALIKGGNFGQYVPLHGPQPGLQTGEKGVVLRLGRYAETMSEGLNFKIPVVDKVVKLNTPSPDDNCGNKL